MEDGLDPLWGSEASPNAYERPAGRRVTKGC